MKVGTTAPVNQNLLIQSMLELTSDDNSWLTEFTSELHLVKRLDIFVCYEVHSFIDNSLCLDLPLV